MCGLRAAPAARTSPNLARATFGATFDHQAEPIHTRQMPTGWETDPAYCRPASSTTASTSLIARPILPSRLHPAVELEDQLADDLAPHLVEMIEQLPAIAVPELAGGIDGSL
jgi:hypothetical protein